MQYVDDKCHHCPRNFLARIQSRCILYLRFLDTEESSRVFIHDSRIRPTGSTFDTHIPNFGRASTTQSLGIQLENEYTRAVQSPHIHQPVPFHSTCTRGQLGTHLVYREYTLVRGIKYPQNEIRSTESSDLESMSLSKTLGILLRLVIFAVVITVHNMVVTKSVRDYKDSACPAAAACAMLFHFGRERFCATTGTRNHVV
jgi:hypothetical protein